jgi:hypothetical protein
MPRPLTRIWVSVTPSTVRFVLHDGEEHADKATGERATVPVPTGWLDVRNGHERPERRENRHVEQETPQERWSIIHRGQPSAAALGTQNATQRRNRFRLVIVPRAGRRVKHILERGQSCCG